MNYEDYHCHEKATLEEQLGEVSAGGKAQRPSFSYLFRKARTK